MRTTCTAAACTVECGEDEIIVTAWCGAARTAPLYPNERSATCRAKTAASNPLMAVCTKTTAP
jgi:hypothetical protein